MAFVWFQALRMIGKRLTDFGSVSSRASGHVYFNRAHHSLFGPNDAEGAFAGLSW